MPLLAESPPELFKPAGEPLIEPDESESPKEVDRDAQFVERTLLAWELDELNNDAARMPIKEFKGKEKKIYDSYSDLRVDNVQALFRRGDKIKWWQDPFGSYEVKEFIEDSNAEGGGYIVMNVESSVIDKALREEKKTYADILQNQLGYRLVERPETNQHSSVIVPEKTVTTSQAETISVVEGNERAQKPLFDLDSFNARTPQKKMNRVLQKYWDDKKWLKHIQYRAEIKRASGLEVSPEELKKTFTLPHAMAVLREKLFDEDTAKRDYMYGIQYVVAGMYLGLKINMNENTAQRLQEGLQNYSTNFDKALQYAMNLKVLGLYGEAEKDRLIHIQADYMRSHTFDEIALAPNFVTRHARLQKLELWAQNEAVPVAAIEKVEQDLKDYEKKKDWQNYAHLFARYKKYFPSTQEVKPASRTAIARDFKIRCEEDVLEYFKTLPRYGVDLKTINRLRQASLPEALPIPEAKPVVVEPKSEEQVPPSPEKNETAPFQVGWESTVREGESPDDNEDAVLVNKDSRVFGMFDGMGGHPYGDVASRTASTFVDNFLKGKLATAGSSVSVEKAKSIVTDCLQEANTVLTQKSKDMYKEAAQHPGNLSYVEREIALQLEKKPMGTTGCVVALFDQEDGSQVAVVGHVGDSRVYVLRKEGQLEHITLDDSDVPRTLSEAQKKEVQRVLANTTQEQDLVGKTLYDVDLERAFERRNRVGQHLGQYEALRPHSYTVTLEAGDRLILTSDGIHDNLTDAEISSIQTEPDATEAARHLVQMAKKVAESSSLRGKRDDTSAVVIEVTSVRVTETQAQIALSAPPEVVLPPSPSPAPEAPRVEQPVAEPEVVDSLKDFTLQQLLEKFETLPKKKRIPEDNKLREEIFKSLTLRIPETLRENRTITNLVLDKRINEYRVWISRRVMGEENGKKKEKIKKPRFSELFSNNQPAPTVQTQAPSPEPAVAATTGEAAVQSSAGSPPEGEAPRTASDAVYRYLDESEQRRIEGMNGVNLATETGFYLMNEPNGIELQKEKKEKIDSNYLKHFNRGVRLLRKFDKMTPEERLSPNSKVLLDIKKYVAELPQEADDISLFSPTGISWLEKGDLLLRRIARGLE